jgi:hypothetical protein
MGLPVTGTRTLDQYRPPILSLSGATRYRDKLVNIGLEMSRLLLRRSRQSGQLPTFDSEILSHCDHPLATITICNYIIFQKLSTLIIDLPRPRVLDRSFR